MKVSLTLTLVLFAIITFVYSASIQNNENIITRALAPIDEQGNFYAEWSANNTTQVISFNLVVRTNGFVGFGLSPGGGMTGADIVVGGVNDTNNQSYFSDRHGDGQSEPHLDSIQNYNLTSAVQNTTHTTLAFQRLFVTGDSNDVDVTDSNITLIWAIGATDVLEYHFANRGVYVTNLLRP